MNDINGKKCPLQDCPYLTLFYYTLQTQFLETGIVMMKPKTFGPYAAILTICY